MNTDLIQTISFILLIVGAVAGTLWHVHNALNEKANTSTTEELSKLLKEFTDKVNDRFREIDRELGGMVSRETLNGKLDGISDGVSEIKELYHQTLTRVAVIEEKQRQGALK